MVEIEGLPASAAGRVALCHDAIQAALDVGFSKKEIAQRLGLAYITFFRAWKAQKIVVPSDKQIPLPAISEIKTNKVNEPAKNAKPETEPENRKPRPLPGQIPVGDGDEMTKALEKKGIVFK